MDWGRVFPRIRAALAPGAVLALVGRSDLPAPWHPELRALVPRYSTNRDYRPYDLVEELTSRGLLEVRGRLRTAPVDVTMTVDAVVERMHSRNGFSRARMSPEAAAEFDTAPA